MTWRLARKASTSVSWEEVMSQAWLLAVDLGSIAMVGVGLLFVVVWAVDRQRSSALFFAGAIAAYVAATLALSVPIDVALASTIHGVLFPLSMVLLADGLRRRIDDRLPPAATIGFVVVMAVVVWYFAYISPLMVARIITQNLGTALLLSAVMRGLWRRPLKTGLDRVALLAAAGLAVSTGVDVVVALFSTVPREITTPAQLDSYLASNLEMCLIVASAVVLPACMVALLGVTVVDVVHELRFDRDRDELTGVFNRRGFSRRAEVELGCTERCGVVLADLDFFKSVNDELGHAGGDKVLVAFARLLADNLEDGRIVGRIGGEEFAVLLPHMGIDGATEWAEAVRSRQAAQDVGFDDRVITVTASFGVAAGDSRSQLAALLDSADRALYVAKLGGRNRIAVTT